MDWNLLLSNKRISKNSPVTLYAGNEEEFRTPFEADYDRVIYSTPFRRLARKTQVHPLALNDHIHTRLTHSLEVSSVGRSLGHRLATFLKGEGHLPAQVTEQDILWIIQAACSAHDIGNPPFGHAGEEAIRQWVSDHHADVFENCTTPISEGLRNDFLIFEGNAQGFRLAARSDNPQTGYMRLTIATLGAMIKYPWDSTDPRAIKKKKYNVFSTEVEIFEEMSNYMEQKRDDGTHARHPLSFLTEAADDICYRILDIEDAVEMRIVPESKVRKLYCQLAKINLQNTDALGLLRGKAIASLINGVWEVFKQDYARIMNGERHEDLKTDLDQASRNLLGEISLLYHEIYAERSKIAAELGALKAMGRIVGTLCSAAAEITKGRSFENAGFLSRRCAELAWSREYAMANELKPYEWWLHQIADYVSGLTDNYARQLSREIEGV